MVAAWQAAIEDEEGAMMGERGKVDATRRRVLAGIGGGLSLAALAAAIGGGRVLAQEATPAAGMTLEGLHVATRTRVVKPEKTSAELDTLTASIRDGLVPMIREIPGFVEYFIIWNETTRERTAVNIFQDKAGADATTPLAVEYLAAQGLNDFYVDADPVVTEGEIILAAG